MRLPRDLSGDDLANALKKYDYRVTRQIGSHMRLTTQRGGEHRLTIPRHDPLKLGTLNAILKDAAEHLKIDRDTLIEILFGK